MRFIDRLAFVLGANVRLEEAKAASSKLPDWLTAGIGPYTQPPDLAVTKKQLELMQQLSWVYNAVTIRAQTAAGTPLSVKKRSGEEQEDIKNHPFELLLEKPNPMQSRFEFLEALFGYRALAGNAYIWLNRANENQPPDEMWLIPPNRIKPVPDGRMFIKGYVYTALEDGRDIPIDVWEICHLKRWHPTNMFVGLSPIEALANGVTADIKMQEWNKNYFAKDNAKMPGALAFKDTIGEADWKLLKEEVAREYGGTNRRIMLLRGAGESVSWLPFSMSQKDMEFLAGRNFNKEEIYAAFAPGLASVLAINATEANSIAGDKTFMSKTIWPDHQAVAEKLTNDILPSYGDNLRAEFDDVRIADRATELQEQSAYALVHTIDEVRARWWDDEPLESGQGERLPYAGGASASRPGSGQPAASGAAGTDAAPDNLVSTQGLNGAQISAALQVVENVTTGITPVEVGRELFAALGIAEDRVNRMVGALQPGSREPIRPQAFGQPPSNEDEKPPKDVTPPDEPMKSELETWQRFVLRRMRMKEPLRAFESDDIPDALKGAIEGALVTAKTAEDVRLIFHDALVWRDYP